MCQVDWRFGWIRSRHSFSALTPIMWLGKFPHGCRPPHDTRVWGHRTPGRQLACGRVRADTESVALTTRIPAAVGALTQDKDLPSALADIWTAPRRSNENSLTDAASVPSARRPTCDRSRHHQSSPSWRPALSSPRPRLRAPWMPSLAARAPSPSRRRRG